MPTLDRRRFLATTGAALAGSALVRPELASAAPGSSPWRKAFMLGVSRGAILPHFERLKAAGFEGVELLSPNELDTAEVNQAREKTGIVVHGVSGSRHWAEPLSSPDEKVVERGLAAIRREFEDCKAYGGTTVLVVPAVVTPSVSYREAWDRSTAAIKLLIPDAEKHGVKMAIEEVWNKFLLSPVEMARYVDSFQSDAVGAYFDVGNVVEYGYPQEWIRELGKRILKIHIKEYKKAKRFDYKLGEGEIDWPAVRKALHDVGYQGWVTAEVGYGDVEALRDVAQRMDQLLGG
ncbi:MAG: sugar phosphate isomerase/epimerase family protein [Isosphaeraceae bacterium]